MDKRILITGGNGLVGRKLSDKLIHLGYFVHVLTRSENQINSERRRYFKWDIERGYVDVSCLDGVHYIIHLAGENIGALPWSNRRKKVVAESRIDSILLLYRLMETVPNEVSTVVSASATGIYGDRGEVLMSEDSIADDSFLGRTCRQWERAVHDTGQLKLRTVSLRSGVILAGDGGMYGKIRLPTRVGLGAVLGNGKQYIPWIYIEDAVNAYVYAMENEAMSGIYNMVAPEQVTNADFTREIASYFGRKVWVPPVPAFALKSVLGQMSDLLLDSARVSATKLQSSGFEFLYPTLKSAIVQCEVDRQPSA